MNATEKTEHLDMRETGAPKDGASQKSERRLYLQLHAFGNCANPNRLVGALRDCGLESVLYRDLNDPQGVGVLFFAESPDTLVGEVREFLAHEPFASLPRKPEMTMVGRTYATGHEPDLEDWLLTKPRRNARNPDWPWAVWYPLRRKPAFARLPGEEQGKILMAHAQLGRAYARDGYAYDIRLACYGLDVHDNDFLIGLVGPDLTPLSRVVQEMRKTRQTAEYIASLGPFFVGKAVWQSPVEI